MLIPIQVLYISIVYTLTILGEKKYYFPHFIGEKKKGRYKEITRKQGRHADTKLVVKKKKKSY